MEQQVNISINVPKSCLECVFCKSVYGNDDLMFGDPEYNFFIGYYCKQNNKIDIQSNAEMLRYYNDTCPFKQHMTIIRKPASVKQKALVDSMEQFEELPKCDDKETAQGCFLYIRDNIDKYKELCRQEEELEEQYDDEGDYEFYAYDEEILKFINNLPKIFITAPSSIVFN